MSTANKERPILFSAPMVRALLDGSKTQTRRMVKPQFAHDAIPCEMGATNDRGHQIAGHSGMWWCEEEGNHEKAVRCPYGQPGDRLWVRETWSHDAESLEQCRVAHEDAMGGQGYGPYYRATESAPDTLRWRPSIHMPRWASRITLEISGVRVERLQDISEADAQAEGVQGHPFRPDDGWPICTGYMIGPDDGKTTLHPNPQDAYRRLWESINGPGSWDANPWVWVIEFRRVPAC